MIRLHHLEHSRSQRVLWLMEELGLAYEIIPYRRDPVTRFAPSELKAVHPLGKSPVIEDEGRIVAESGAIVEYLAKRHGQGKLWPAEDAPNWVEHLHWMHFAEGSAMLPLLLALYVGRLGEAGAPLKPRIDGEIANHLSYMERALGSREYFAGAQFTACDVHLTFVLEAAAARGRLADYPGLTRYLARVQARSAYQRALERGGPYRLGGR